jgi:hypothetical protein
MLRRCGRCGLTKPVAEFAWRRKLKGQRDNYCRPCRSAYKKEHYAANKARYIERAAARKVRLSRLHAEKLIEYFATHPCVDCGETDPLVLEFDHRGDKEFDISRVLPYKSWEAILREIEKCDVRCANCHRRITAIRGGWARAGVAQR